MLAPTCNIDFVEGFLLLTAGMPGWLGLYSMKRRQGTYLMRGI